VHPIFCVFAKLRKGTISFVMSVRPSLSVSWHETTRFSLDGFWWNLLFELFPKICWENSSFIKIRQELQIFYKQTLSHLRQYLPELFLEWETFQIKVMQEINIHVLYPIFFLPRKSCRLCREVWWSQRGRKWQYGRALHAGLVRIQARKHKPGPLNPHPEAHTYTRARARTHTNM
jgi:hypothetical protein